MKIFAQFIVVITALLSCSNASAVLDIQITEGMQEALPIAIVPFGWSQSGNVAPIDVADIIASDLARSGRFNPMEQSDIPQQPTAYEQVNFKDWRLLGMENLVIGNLILTTNGEYQLEFRLLDVYREKQIAGFRVPATQNSLRFAAHKISDVIYENLTGVRGAFATKIAYITVEGKVPNTTHSLHIADADGYNPQILLKSPEPLMSPSWSPDGRKLAYVSFEGKNSAIYIQDIQSGQREKVQASPGINSAPSFSPDGSRLAMTLSKDGNPEIYILHLNSKLLQRITQHPAIDTEPSWSNDGERLVFTSDRTGGPQIYEVEVRGGKAKRLSFEGKYNTRPIYTPDEENIALVHGDSGNYHIALLEKSTGFINVLTDTRLDESPSVAPNGHMVIYATMGYSGTELAAVSIDGQVHQRLGNNGGQVRDPAWGPFPEN